MTKHRDKLLDRRIFYNGTVIFAEGSRGDAAFLIEDGNVRLTQKADAAMGVEIATVGKNGIFGEMALFDDNPRMATATAQGTVVVVAIGREDFDRKIRKLDEDVRLFLKNLIRYCRETPVYCKRQMNPDDARETQYDKMIRSALKSPVAKNALELKDPFLLALCNILISYVQRRLSPEEKEPRPQ